MLLLTVLKVNLRPFCSSWSDEALAPSDCYFNRPRNYLMHVKSNSYDFGKPHKKQQCVDGAGVSAGVDIVLNPLAQPFPTTSEGST